MDRAAKRVMAAVVLVVTTSVHVAAEDAPARMVLIPRGVHVPLFKTEGKVEVQPFYLDQYPVTNAEFLEFVQANPTWRRSRVKRLFTDAAYLMHWQDDLEIGPAGGEGGNNPVTYVSWFAAKAYARWSGKRLPTQAEWELVAAASETHADGREEEGHYQYILNWYSKPTTHPFPPIGSTFRNFYGVFDMHGLVWEWVLDFNTATVTGESRGDTGLDRQLFCGSGSVNASDFKDYAAFMRYAFRSSLQARYVVPNLGFRCARDVETRGERE